MKKIIVTIAFILAFLIPFGTVAVTVFLLPDAYFNAFTGVLFNVNQPLEEAMSVSVTIKPTDSTRAPSWKTGSGS